LWVLSPDGAAEENAWVKTWPNVYYFSFATRATYTGIFSGWEYPTPTMNPLFMPLAYPNVWPLPPGMGNYTRNQPGKMVLDSSWWANDGIVNTKSMVAPWNASSVAVNWTGTAQKGKWNYMGMPSGLDHLDIVGWSPFWDARSFYLTHANRLRAL
jgi:triacylglycerol lipase